MSQNGYGLKIYNKVQFCRDFKISSFKKYDEEWSVTRSKLYEVTNLSNQQSEWVDDALQKVKEKKRKATKPSQSSRSQKAYRTREGMMKMETEKNKNTDFEADILDGLSYLH